MSDELDRVRMALGTLRMSQPIWRKNWEVFIAMDDVAKHYWWERMKKQAEAGAPAAQTLLLKVIELRML